MAIRIKLAKTTAEMDALFKLRHKVFVEEKRYMPPSCNGRLSDCFDSYPTTANVVALVDGKVVGGLRFVEPSYAGTPADTFFDFTPYISPEAKRVGSGSMLLVDPDYRAIPNLTHAMLGMGHYWAISRGLTHITGISAPVAEKLFLGCGYRAVVERFFHQPTQLYAMPVILDLKDLNARLRRFIDEQSAHGFHETFDRQFLMPGEKIFSVEDEDESGASYRILEGSIALTTENKASAVGEAYERPTRKSPSVLKAGACFSRDILQGLRTMSGEAFALTELSLMVTEQNELSRPWTGISQEALWPSPVALGQMMTRTDGLMSSPA